MTKHVVDIDDDALGAARAELGTRTIKDTVHQALVRVGGDRAAVVKDALDRLADLALDDRTDTWR